MVRRQAWRIEHATYSASLAPCVRRREEEAADIQRAGALVLRSPVGAPATTNQKAALTGSATGLRV